MWTTPKGWLLMQPQPPAPDRGVIPPPILIDGNRVEIGVGLHETFVDPAAIPETARPTSASLGAILLGAAHAWRCRRFRG